MAVDLNIVSWEHISLSLHVASHRPGLKHQLDYVALFFGQSTSIKVTFLSNNFCSLNQETFSLDYNSPKNRILIDISITRWIKVDHSKIMDAKEKFFGEIKSLVKSCQTYMAIKFSEDCGTSCLATDLLFFKTANNYFNLSLSLSVSVAKTI